jgi:hypothetical protein
MSGKLTRYRGPLTAEEAEEEEGIWLSQKSHAGLSRMLAP